MKNRLSIGWQLMFFGFIGALTNIINVQAQVIPDMTLGQEKSRVTSANLIEGGAQRGENLFHSFQQFNISEGNIIQFANPKGIENIFSRVTGGDLSHINGTLGVNGRASLYFINPAGIMFGPNAQLDISGSFTASTANEFIFGEGITFSAVTPQVAPTLLQINVPLGLQFGTEYAADIRNLGQLETGQNLTLSANNIEISGVLFAEGKIILQAQGIILVNGGFIGIDTLLTEQIGDITINTDQLLLRERTN